MATYTITARSFDGLTSTSYINGHKCEVVEGRTLVITDRNSDTVFATTEWSSVRRGEVSCDNPRVANPQGDA